YYYELRHWDRKKNFMQRPIVDRCARFLFLNRFGYNGMFRVNSNGEFNVPFGRTKNIFEAGHSISPINVEYFSILSSVLNKSNCEFKCQDYKKILETIKSGDLVYLDPPYEPISKTSAFAAYTKFGFTFDDQK